MKSVFFNSNALLKLLAIAGLASTLVACGGGGSSSSSLGISGTAATGKALDAAAVTVACVSGAGAATSDGGGNYTVLINNFTGPCVLTVKKGSVVLHSITSKGGTVNITPLTELLASYLATRSGTSIDTLLSSPNGKAILGDDKAIAAGQTTIVNYLKANFFVTISDGFLGTVIVTPQGGAQSPLDKDLDALRVATVITSDGNANPTVNASIKVEGQKSPFVAPTGATGATAS